MITKGNVSFIGLGAMGMGMATHLVEDGFTVTGFDVNLEALRTLESRGGKGATSPRECSTGTSVLVCMVTNASQCHEALLDESTGAVQSLSANATVILCSTVPPHFPAKIQQSVASEWNRSDIRVVDCPVSGGTVRAANGTLTILSSGSQDALVQARPILHSMSEHLYEIRGGLGAASKVKLINQQLAGIHIAAAAEAMALGAILGLNTQELFEGAIGSPAWSWMFENRVPHMLDDDWTPHSALGIFVKDMGIVTSEASRRRFPAFLSSATEQLYLLGAGMGFERQDDSGVVRVFCPQQTSLISASTGVEGSSTETKSHSTLVIQLLEIIHTVAATEATALGVQMGIPISELAPVISTAAGASEIFKLLVKKLRAGDLSTGPTINDRCRDLETIVSLARQHQYSLPLGGAALQTYHVAILHGVEKENDVALLKLWPAVSTQLQLKRLQPTREIATNEHATLSLQETISILPPFQYDTKLLLQAVQERIKANPDFCMVVLDDDPTGTQTCHGINVLTTWDVATLCSEFKSNCPGFFILTNSRALPSHSARQLIQEILVNVRESALAAGKAFEVILRGDPTLRGHIREEIEAYTDVLGSPDAWIITPFFQQGGRLTINDTHYVVDGESLIPVVRTPFASDATSGYRSSNLMHYLEEKMSGFFGPNSVTSISLEDIRQGGGSTIAEKLLAVPKGGAVIVNAVQEEDMLLFCAGVLHVQSHWNRRFGYRVAASFVSTRLGMGTRAPLGPGDLPVSDTVPHVGGLTVAGGGR